MLGYSVLNNFSKKQYEDPVDGLIGYREFYAVSATFRPYNGGDPVEWVLGISVLS